MTTPEQTAARLRRVAAGLYECDGALNPAVAARKHAHGIADAVAAELVAIQLDLTSIGERLAELAERYVGPDVPHESQAPTDDPDAFTPDNVRHAAARDSGPPELTGPRLAAFLVDTARDGADAAEYFGRDDLLDDLDALAGQAGLARCGRCRTWTPRNAADAFCGCPEGPDVDAAAWAKTAEATGAGLRPAEEYAAVPLPPGGIPGDVVHVDQIARRVDPREYTDPETGVVYGSDDADQTPPF